MAPKPTRAPSSTELFLNQEAAKPNELAGSSNTIVLSKAHPDALWRITRGSDEEAAARAHTLQQLWVPEADLQTLLGELGISPRVYDKLGPGTWLFDQKHRGAMLVERLPEDLHQALHPEPSTRLPSLADDPEAAHLAGLNLVDKCLELGNICLVHGDLKPENVLVRILHSNSRIQVEIKMIDFDPMFVYGGEACFSAMLSAAYPGEQVSSIEWACALAAVLNLVLAWQGFEVLADKNAGELNICEALSAALRACHFPLDQVEEHFPAPLKRRIRVWTKAYRDAALDEQRKKSHKKSSSMKAPARQRDHPRPMLSVCAAAARRFPGLSAKTFDWTKGPRLPREHFPRAVPIVWTAARRRLRTVLLAMPQATCSQELANP